MRHASKDGAAVAAAGITAAAEIFSDDGVGRIRADVDSGQQFDGRRSAARRGHNSRARGAPLSIAAVVRRFAGDRHIVHMAFAKTRAC